MESILKKHFGKVLSDIRKQEGVSQQEVADNCGIERAYISRLERGVFNPPSPSFSSWQITLKLSQLNWWTKLMA